MVFWPLLRLTRPINASIGYLSVWTAAFVAGSIHPLVNVRWAAASAMAILAGGNVVNDLFDVETDRINQPTRPLVMGTVSSQTAWIAAVVLFGIGIACSLRLALPMLGMALLATGLLVFYNLKLKRTLLWGNLTVSFLGGVTFLYGGMAVGRIRGAVIPAILAFGFHLGREILKDVEDCAGDRATQANTLAVRYGPRRALGWATTVFGILVICTPLPYLFGAYSSFYLFTVLIGVDTVLAYVVGSMWYDRSPRNLARLSRLLKADMVVGLLAIVLGRG
ncbi:MAG: geranylgeranylglycerol-phosphate geranylgeranyltransferase [Candidatus Latescibacterota bacterium]